MCANAEHDNFEAVSIEPIILGTCAQDLEDFEGIQDDEIFSILDVSLVTVA